MSSKISLSLILLLITGAVYELYIDAILTKYYLLSLHYNEPYHVCMLSEPHISLLVYDRSLNIVQSFWIPPFYTFTTKSLSSQPHCLTLSSHYEGFSPGSLSVNSPWHQSHWTLSYSGRLCYRPAIGLVSQKDFS